MADILHNSFEQAFQKKGKWKRSIFLMDRSLPQNSKTAHFPDLNPIENVFHLDSKSPARQAIQKKTLHVKHLHNFLQEPQKPWKNSV